MRTLLSVSLLSLSCLVAACLYPCETGVTRCLDRCGGEQVVSACGNACVCTCPAGTVDEASCLADGGAVDGGVSSSGAATLTGPSSFPVGSALARARDLDGGADLSQVDVSVAEAPYACSGNTVILASGSDAGQARTALVTLRGTPGSPFPVGQYGAPGGGSATASVALGPPGGTGSFTQATQSLVVVDEVSSARVRGSFTARFPPDTQDTVGTFDAVLCGTFLQP